MNFLAIETSGTICSVALQKGTQTFTIEKLEPNSHSTHLHLLIEQIMQENELTYNELNAIILSEGPGSYTGLRIGSSCAKGICIAAALPLIAVSAHQSMCYSNFVNNSFSHFLCMTDARRDEAYITLFDHQNNALIATKAMIIENADFLETFAITNLLIQGSGAFKMNNKYSKQHVIVENECLDAKQLLPLGIKKFQNNTFENIHLFEPNYLKEFYTVPSKKTIF